MEVDHLDVINSRELKASSTSQKMHAAPTLGTRHPGTNP
jgi:hypothetical protein